MTIARKEYKCDVCDDPIPIGADYLKVDNMPWEGEEPYEATPKFHHYHLHKECYGIIMDYCENDADEGYDSNDILNAKTNADALLPGMLRTRDRTWAELRKAYRKAGDNRPKLAVKS